MSDLNLIYTAIQTMAAANETQHGSIITRLDHINGTVRRHDHDLGAITTKQQACQANCIGCLARLEPAVTQLEAEVVRIDVEIKLAKRVGAVLASIFGALLTAAATFAAFF